MTDVLVFPDIATVIIQQLHAALAAREPVTGRRVVVADEYPEEAIPETAPWVVTVQRDGGTRSNVLREHPRLRLNVWGPKEGDVDDLAQEVRALMDALPDSRTVLRVTEIGGPSAVPDPSGQPRRVMWFETTTRAIEKIEKE